MEDAKAKCPTCGSAFPAGATFCPECGYVVPLTLPAAAPLVQPAAPLAPQSNVVYVQPPAVAPRESNWGPWVTLAAVALLAVGGFALWNGGYLGSSGSATQPASTVTIDNSPQMTSEAPQDSAIPVADPIPAPAAAQPSVLPPSPPPSTIPDIDIISVKGQALETNAVEWKYGYTLRLRNNTNSAVTASFRIQFLDEQGFPVDDDVMNDLVIPANVELSFTGDDQIKTALAKRVRTLLAEVR